MSKKDFQNSLLRFALCFPDIYEVGMSNIGIRIIYGLLNSIPEVCCERFFSADLDMEGILRSSNGKIVSLESKRPLNEFDIAGFSLNHELCYTNALALLELGGVPLKTCERTHLDPLVIAGGACSMNPEPVHEFFDLFVIGEAEEALIEVTNVYKKHRDDFKNAKLSRRGLLSLLAEIDGVYAPSLYDVKYFDDGSVKEFLPLDKSAKRKISKRFVKDFDGSYYPEDWLLPYIQIVHDRVGIELTRGCPNTCRFCQAREQFHPLRIRKPDTILNIASRSYSSSGYEEIALAGLSVSDYPGIKDLISKLVEAFKEKRVGISLPSLKPSTMLGEVSNLIASIKKTNLTFAPEAATERLRRVIGKDFDLKSFSEVVKEARGLGYRHVKLYFMVGLPTEEREDVGSIVDFANNVSGMGMRPLQINLSVNTFIPKPHTPLQWSRMIGLEEMEGLHAYLKSKIKTPRIRLNFHNSFMSFLEGVFSRGNRNLSKVILNAYRRGARFDAWDNHFSFQRWQEAFIECGIDPNPYTALRSQETILPWDFIETGTARDKLKLEANKIIAFK